MQHLSGMDASFLHLETPETPMHVGGLHVPELPENHRGDFHDDLRQHIADRMHRSPVFTRKLALMPFRLVGPRTLFNVAITNHRAYAGRSIPLAEARQIAKRAGVTLNDVVLATCGGALRRYLSDSNELPRKSLTAAVPVSLREQGNTDANNQVSMTVTTLATDVADPVERMRASNVSSAAAKSLMGTFEAAIPTDFPSFGAPWPIAGLASMYGRSGLANALPPVANVAVSNVPGAPLPLYVCGALMKTYFPVSIPTHAVGLNITVQSYNGSLDYGLIACRRAVPNIADLADYLVEEHAKLLARVPEPAAPAPTLPVKRTAEAAAKASRKTVRKTVREPRAPAATVR